MIKKEEIYKGYIIVSCPNTKGEKRYYVIEKNFVLSGNTLAIDGCKRIIDLKEGA